MPTRPLFVLTLCGTSLVTNRTDQSLREVITRHANARQAEDVLACSAEDHGLITHHLAILHDRLADMAQSEARSHSAEMNSILSIYEGNFSNCKGDLHLLLSTDTWLGEATAKLVQSWMAQQGLTAWVRRQQDLRTDSLDSFQMALSDLVRWCDEEVAPYRRSYRVLFNLTGGFKSIQGFLQILAQFYADETVYIFESGDVLLRMPRLPIIMDTDAVVRAHLPLFRRMALGLPVSSGDVSAIPETLRITIENQACLSHWGELVWAQTKKKIYADKVFEPLTDSLVFGRDFEAGVATLEAHRRVTLNERIDDLVRYLEVKRTGRSGSVHLQSLDFKKLAGNPTPPSTHECDAWHDHGAKRLFGHFEDEVFVIDRLGTGLH